MGYPTPPSKSQTPQPARLLVTLTEADLRALLDEHTERIEEVIAARPPEHLLTPGEASQILQVSPPTVAKLRREGMPAIKMGETWRYERTVILEWLRQRTEAEK